jgi:5'-methylthioadenosine phosphorylase
VAEVGIIGGSGFYELLEDASEQQVDTPYGPPSDVVVTGRFGGRDVAFVPRHGGDHSLPPHRVPYRANVWALRQLGVRRVLAPCAVGALRADLPIGAFVVLDQLVDRTKARDDTFFVGPDVQHVSMADPYCPQLRQVVARVLADGDHPSEPGGTCVVIEGPRFSTRAESRWFSAMGWDVVGMTQYPEIPLLREAGVCAAGIAIVTDHDAGLEDHPDVEPVTHEAVLEAFAENVDVLKTVLVDVVAAIPDDRACDCDSSPPLPAPA